MSGHDAPPVQEPVRRATDVARVQRIEAVPRILSAVARITGMRFAAVARVTDCDWTACAVLDDLGFGLQPGGQLELATTICDEIRQHHRVVAFDHASEHPVFSRHHTPLKYGLESYISVPIFLDSGEFFGTLCAIDSRPAEVDDPVVIQSLQLFAEMIGMQLRLVDELDAALARLGDARFRESLASAHEHDVRDLLQPIVTNLYLLRTSETLSAQDRALVDDMETACGQLTDLIRVQLDVAMGRIERQLR